MQAMENLLREGDIPEGSILFTEYQSDGQGQGSNQWESESGKNLLLSIYVQAIFLEPSYQFMISKAAALAVLQTVLNAVPAAKVRIKWPNDIYVDQQKIAGILIRHNIKGSLLDRSLIGIGLNVNQKVFVSDAPNPVSLIHLDKKERSIEDMLDVLQEMFRFYYAKLKAGNNALIDDLYHQYLYRLGYPSPYRLRNETVEAFIRGVDEYGRMILDQGGRLHLCEMKEVEFV